MKSYLNFLSRNKAYTFINVFGLGLSLTFVILIFLYDESEKSVNRLAGTEQTYLMAVDYTESGTHEQWSGSSRELIRVLKERCPQVESGCALFFSRGWQVGKGADDRVKADLLCVDSTFFSFFPVPLAEGSANTVLRDNTSAVISQAFARAFFGTANPIGKTLVLGHQQRLHVEGVYQNFSGTMLPDADILCRYELLRDVSPELFRLDGNFGDPEVYLKLRQGTDATVLEKQIDQVTAPIYKDFFPKGKLLFKLLPFQETYFSEYGSAFCSRGNSKLVNVLFAVGLVILLFSVMNYINLTVAQSGRRAHEMATRRLLGSQRSDIIRKLVGESILLCLVSSLLSILLAWALIPQANSLLNAHIAAVSLLSPLNLLLMAVLVLVTGTLAGMIPASLISRYKPIDVVKGTFQHATRMVLGKVFIVIQNVITMILIAISLVMSLQIRHIVNAPLGYDTRHVMEISLPAGFSKNMTFKAELLRQSFVVSASLSNGSPITGGYNQMYNHDNRSVRLQRFYADGDYFKTLGLKVRVDYHNTPDGSPYVSTGYEATMGLPTGTRQLNIYEDSTEHVAGVLEPVHVRDITDPNDSQVNLFYIYRHPERTHIFDHVPNMLLIHVSGNAAAAVKGVADIYRKVYHEEMDADHPFIYQSIENMFEQEIRVSRILTLFAFVAILISLLGLIAMSTYYIQQRAKEIAIRKVFGSTNKQVRVRLICSFLAYVGIAALIALPVIWYVVSDWIAQYTYRITWWHCILLSILSVGLIGFCAVAIQSWAASDENPVGHLKNE